MVSVGRILRDYRDAGSVNGLLALWGFVDDTTFLTKAGHVGVVYRVRGVFVRLQPDTTYVRSRRRRRPRSPHAVSGPRRTTVLS